MLQRALGIGGFIAFLVIFNVLSYVFGWGLILY